MEGLFYLAIQKDRPTVYFRNYFFGLGFLFFGPIGFCPTCF
jgi:hypothetical protein